MKSIQFKHVALASLLVCGSAAQAQISGDVVKIGIITDMSSVYADIDGAGGVEAIKMAIADMKGMVAGKKIELIFAGPPEQGRRGRQQGARVDRHPGPGPLDRRHQLGRQPGHGQDRGREEKALHRHRRRVRPPDQ